MFCTAECKAVSHFRRQRPPEVTFDGYIHYRFGLILENKEDTHNATFFYRNLEDTLSLYFRLKITHIFLYIGIIQRILVTPAAAHSFKNVFFKCKLYHFYFIFPVYRCSKLGLEVFSDFKCLKLQGRKWQLALLRQKLTDI